MADQQQAKPTPDFRAVYKAGVKIGFDVTVARWYFRDGDGSQPRTEQTMETPFTWKGMDVVGYTDTDTRTINRQGPYKLYTTDVSELYVKDNVTGELHNLDYQIGPGDPKTVTMRNGQEVTLEKVHENMRLFASAAAEYPHVLMFDEYMESQSYAKGRFGLAPPKESDYTETYLPGVEQQMASRDAVFTGFIRKPSDLHMAYESAPSVQEEMADFHESVDRDMGWGE